MLKAWAQLPGLASDFVREFRPRADVLIFGHTHRAKFWKRGGRLLINTGAFVTFARPLAIEISGGALTVRSIENDRGKWRQGAVVTRHPWSR